MGPQRFRRGDSQLDSFVLRGIEASMGPQRFRRGDAKAIRQESHLRLASMGPQRFRRGDMGTQSTPSLSVVLQWGRSVSAAEMLHADDRHEL